MFLIDAALFFTDEIDVTDLDKFDVDELCSPIVLDVIFACEEVDGESAAGGIGALARVVLTVVVSAAKFCFVMELVDFVTFDKFFADKTGDVMELFEFVLDETVTEIKLFNFVTVLKNFNRLINYKVGSITNLI